MKHIYKALLDEMHKKRNELELGDATPKKILLADDEIFSQITVKTMIEQAGNYSVVAFLNGLQVLQDPN